MRLRIVNARLVLLLRQLVLLLPWVLLLSLRPLPVLAPRKRSCARGGTRLIVLARTSRDICPIQVTPSQVVHLRKLWRSALRVEGAATGRGERSYCFRVLWLLSWSGARSVAKRPVLPVHTYFSTFSASLRGQRGIDGVAWPCRLGVY
jgi:hypothetical protein